MRRIISGMAAALALLAGAAAHAQGDNEQRQQALRALEASLHPRQGAIDISQAKARLDLGQRYDFLGPEDAKRVLTEGWGNPPESVSDVLGLVYPHGSSLFVKEAWAAVITYEQTFYVSDKDVAKSDYDKLLSDMKSGEDKENSERQKAGFAPVHLVGWAQPPAYDRARHNLIWARDIKFDGQDVDTLNYDMRHLGRHGVLSVNIVAGMDQLADIRTAANDLAPTAEFLPGERYADHEASDKAAGYGLVGLVAAGAGLAVAKKAGLLAVILLFAKKGLVIIAAAGAAAWNWLRRLFGAKAKSTSAPSPIVEGGSNAADGTVQSD